MFVLDDEDHVKTREDGGHEVNVLRESEGGGSLGNTTVHSEGSYCLSLGVVPATKHRVGSSQH